eukprot:CAMPEP_0206475276 /NCGR_PEP_ID=MMETSP0324_2-20121206/33980_1 /ASSEMBLY_ACC=CAM_ASM_000836 /TAXON_ID=2866 /ORGANISM="Crypthecodinium cohnii, Strain Seligo" /LENGTH=53 /DNA_ID=CAMNT_0053950597 /DNA_START=428 /DNA_END=589 /DNA_ORIENTATION=-
MKIPGSVASGVEMACSFFSTGCESWVAQRWPCATGSSSEAMSQMLSGWSQSAE